MSDFCSGSKWYLWETGVGEQEYKSECREFPRQIYRITRTRGF